MDDYISRQAILKHIEKIRQSVQMMDDTRRASIVMNGMYLCEKAVRNQPSADVVEVVRCKDCKHYEIWQLKSDYTDDKRYKPSVCIRGRYAVHHSPDWFCADAERRTDEQVH